MFGEKGIQYNIYIVQFGRYLPVQVKLDFSVVEHHGELGAAGVKVESAELAMVKEPGYVLLAGVAVSGHASRRPGEELEGAFGVKRVSDGRRGDGAMHVEVVVAGGALVPRPDSGLLAAVALERKLRVFKSELVLRVAEVGDFIVFHG